MSIEVGSILERESYRDYKFRCFRRVGGRSDRLSPHLRGGGRVRPRHQRPPEGERYRQGAGYQLGSGPHRPLHSPGGVSRFGAAWRRGASRCSPTRSRPGGRPSLDFEERLRQFIKDSEQRQQEFGDVLKRPSGEAGEPGRRIISGLFPKPLGPPSLLASSLLACRNHWARQ